MAPRQSRLNLQCCREDGTRERTTNQSHQEISRGDVGGDVGGGVGGGAAVISELGNRDYLKNHYSSIIN